MKKLFTLIFGILLGGTMFAQSEVDIDISSGWTWGYNSTTEYESGVMITTLTGTYGAASIGWNSGNDWSKYNKLTVVLDSYTNDWGKIFFASEDGTIAEKEFGAINSQTSVVVEFDPAMATAVKQLSIQGKAKDDVIKVSRVYLTESVAYEETGKEIAFDEWGNILASEFEGFSDNAKVVFTYTTTGELTNADGSVVGWGTGSIESIDGSVKVADVPVKSLGDNELSFLLSELKPALAAGPDQYTRYGLYWNMYAQGNSTSTRKSVVVYELKDASEEPQATVIWEGNADFGTSWDWDSTIGLSGSAFSRVKSGESLVFEFTTNSDAEYSQLKILFGQWGNDNHNMPSALVGVANDTYDTFDINAGSTSYTLTLTDDDIATLKSEGLRISGFNMTVTKITSVQATAINNVESFNKVNDDNIYNIAGQKVDDSYKGIVIKNGKKVVVK